VLQNYWLMRADQPDPKPGEPAISAGGNRAHRAPPFL